VKSKTVTPDVEIVDKLAKKRMVLPRAYATLVMKQQDFCETYGSRVKQDNKCLVLKHGLPGAEKPLVYLS
jgi:hypothetical protein